MDYGCWKHRSFSGNDAGFTTERGKLFILRSRLLQKVSTLHLKGKLSNSLVDLLRFWFSKAKSKIFLKKQGTEHTFFSMLYFKVCFDSFSGPVVLPADSTNRLVDTWTVMEKRGGGLRFRKDLPVFIEEDHHEVGASSKICAEPCILIVFIGDQ